MTKLIATAALALIATFAIVTPASAASANTPEKATTAKIGRGHDNRTEVLRIDTRIMAQGGTGNI